MVMMMAENNQSNCIGSSNHIKSSNININDCDFDFGFEFTKDEIDLADTLLNLPYLITKSLSSYRFSLSWASKRRRSTLDNPPPPNKVVVLPLPPPATTVAKPPPTSPDSPLVFSPSESEAKSKQRKTSVKRTREGLQRMVDEKLQTRQTLKEEIEKVKLHLEKVKAENYKLKSIKHKYKAQLEACEGLNRATECIPRQIAVDNNQVHAGPSTSMEFHNQSPLLNNNHEFIVNHTVQVEQGFREKSSVGPLGFDLNVPSEEMIAMERITAVGSADSNEHDDEQCV